MNLEELKNVVKVMEILGGNNTTEKSGNMDGNLNGEYCLIRTYSAGVHLGYVEQECGQDILLKDSRRIWSWEGAFTLSKIAESGFEKAKMSVPVPRIKLKQVIEIIPIKNDSLIEKFKNWSAHND